MDFEPPLYNQINLFLLVLGMVLCIVPELVHGLFCLVHRNEPRLPAIPGVLPSFPTVWDRVWTLFFITLVTGFVSFSLLAKDAELTAEPTFSSILSSITADIFLYLPMVLRMITVTWKGQDNGLGFHMISPLQLFKCGFLYVIIPPFVVAALMEQLHLPELLHEFTSTPVTQEVMETFRKSDNSTLRMGIALLAIVIAPITEECCFRGFLYNSIKQHAGGIMATLISSFFFAAIHTSLVAFLPLFVFAVFQCELYRKTHSLTAPIIAHAVFNSISVLAAFLLTDS